MTKIDQEPDHVQRGILERAAIIVAIGIAASVGATFWIAGSDLREVMGAITGAPSQIETTDFGDPTPQELARVRDTQWLDSYGWVDRSAGIIHVPIDVARDLYLEEKTR